MCLAGTSDLHVFWPQGATICYYLNQDQGSPLSKGPGKVPSKDRDGKEDDEVIS